MEHTLEMMVNAFTEAEDLMAFAVAWDIQESPVVRSRLYQLRNRENDNQMVNTELTVEMEDNLELALEYVREQEEIEGAVKALLFDDEMEALAKTCVDDGEWDPPSPVQEGRGDEPQPGPSNQLQYTMKKTSQCTYAKNAAIDRTYKVKIDEKNNGQQLKDVR